MCQRTLLTIALLVATGCGGATAADHDGGTGDASPPGADAGLDAIAAGPQVSAELRVDNFGWRPNDRRRAVLLGNAGATVELRRASDDSVAGTFTASQATSDEDSGDLAATVDFSGVTEIGDYYLLLPATSRRSYVFRIAPGVYDVVGAAAMKASYYQRCNHDKALPYATDALAGFDGLGGQWVDGACHPTDSAVPAGPGSPDHGSLDLRGGWHDAGDYQKTLWARGVPEMLFAYEINPGAWHDGQLNIPESGNGVPDLLDEVRWELDYYLRMQRPDGHFMTSTKGRDDATVSSPPSACDETRVYYDCTQPDNGEPTVFTATGNAVLSLAHAAIVFRGVGQTATADAYQAAARTGWAWLYTATPADADERRLRASAAAAVHRMDPTQTTAKSVVDGFAWSTFDGLLPDDFTPGEAVLAAGAWHVLLNSAAGVAVQAAVGGAVAQGFVDGAFDNEGAYGGMAGGPGNGWDYSWGSNRAQSLYGANLLMAAHLGILGSHDAAEVAALAQKHLHFMLGLNPLNMVYLTNMAAYGGEHSSFQVYHGWFSYTGNDDEHGNVTYNGLPAAVVEPLYPYYADDTQTSRYGPAPGLVPGGANLDYSGTYALPSRVYPAYAYRDFSVGCVWNGTACIAASWELTEPQQVIQGPFVLLVSFVMSGS
jgi:endoglucanase